MQPSVSVEEARKMFQRVLSEFGIYLDLEICNGEGAATFTWGKVFLPKWYLTRPRNIVLQTLRHEVGHRVVFPGKPDWEKLAMVLARKNGVLDPGLFTNMVADWFTDFELLKKYGGEYYSRVVDAVKGYNGKDPRYWVVVSVYQFMAEELGVKSPNIVAKAEKLCGSEVVETAREAFRVIVSSTSLESKIERLAQILKKYFDPFTKWSFERKPKGYRVGYIPAIKRLSPVFPIPEKLEGDGKNPVRDREWLVQKLVLLFENPEGYVNETTNAPVFLIKMGIGCTGKVRFASDEVVVEASRLKLYAKYVEALERLGSSASSVKVEELEQWTIGDLPFELRVEETLRVYGEILPPVFSLKYSEKEEPESGTKGGCVIIVLDCSGSMRPSMKVAKQAAFSIIQEARKRGDEVFLVLFSGEAVAIPPGKNYDVYEKAIAAVKPSGGTVLPTALACALEYASKVGTAATFIISDAGTKEVDLSIKMIRKLQESGKVVFFWLGRFFGDYAEHWLRESGAKVYMVPYNRDFTEEALREAMW